jgi:hypothetical protein
MVGPTVRRSPALRRRARAGLLFVSLTLLAGPATSDAVPAPETTPVPEASEPLDGEASAPLDGEASAPLDGEASAPLDGEASAPLDAETIDARIREIETAIARDEKALKAWVARREEENGAEAFAANPELREIASRLPRLQSELRSLRQQRAALESP